MHEHVNIIVAAVDVTAIIAAVTVITVAVATGGCPLHCRRLLRRCILESVGATTSALVSTVAGETIGLRFSGDLVLNAPLLSGLILRG